MFPPCLPSYSLGDFLTIIRRSSSTMLLALPLILLLTTTTTTATMLPGSGGGSSNLNPVTTQECTDEWNGVVVGDIGNGAIFQPNYTCESNGEVPVGVIVPSPGEPINTDGAVCCGPSSGLVGTPTPPATADLPNNNNGDGNGGGGSNTGGVLPPNVATVGAAIWNNVTMTRQECVDDVPGVVVGDIGNGAVFQPDYRCESNGQPPVAVVIPTADEPIATDGEVCCELADNDSPPSSSLSNYYYYYYYTPFSNAITMTAALWMIITATATIML